MIVVAFGLAPKHLSYDKLLLPGYSFFIFIGRYCLCLAGYRFVLSNLAPHVRHARCEFRDQASWSYVKSCFFGYLIRKVDCNALWSLFVRPALFIAMRDKLKKVILFLEATILLV